MAPVLLDLINQYPILTTLASYLSTLDLFHLGLTSHAFHSPILSSPSVFAVLRRDCLCDGRGLRHRENARNYPYFWGQIHQDEEIEVRLFATQCDEAGALPCRKCGINICEECREAPRVRGPISRRPHFNQSSDNLLCLCPPCDARLENELKGKFLNETCDCDRYTRWICRRCVEQERRETKAYYEKHTVREVDDYEHYEEFYDLTMVRRDDQFDILFYCTCGAFVPQDMRPRCAWCKRRHSPPEEWGRERREVERLPVDDGSYPVFGPAYPHGYPELPYKGPVYQGAVGNGVTLPVRSYPRIGDAAD
ncbi:hypothetical protein F5Y04DRAFT_253418 [Hypomontagnella monticulosa]|nr:hypothetical protein F5Y04DRAFT_253418 [Hypomontagnella monticulosa]